MDYPLSINELAENLDTRFSALDKNLRDSFSSVKRDIISLRHEYSENLKGVLAQLEQLRSASSKSEAERRAQIIALQHRIDALTEREKVILNLEKRLSEYEERLNGLPKKEDLSQIRAKMEEVSRKSASKEELKQEVNSLMQALKNATSIEEVRAIKKRIEEEGRKLEEIQAWLNENSELTAKISEQLKKVEDKVSKSAEKSELARVQDQLQKRIAASQKEISEHRNLFVPKALFYEEVEYLDKELDSLTLKIERAEQMRRQLEALKSNYNKIASEVSTLSKDKVSVAQFQKSAELLAKQIERARAENESSVKNAEVKINGSISEIRNRITSNEEEFAAVENALLGRIEKISKSAVNRGEFSRRITSLSQGLSKRISELSRKASNSERRMSYLEDAIAEQQEMGKRLSAIGDRLNKISEAQSAESRRLERRIEGLKNSAATKAELSEKAAEIGRKIEELSSQVEEGDNSIRESLEKVRASSATRQMLSARIAELRGELLKLRNSISGISKDIERLETMKADESAFREEYSFLEKKLFYVEKRVSELDALKKELSALRISQQKLEEAQKQFAGKAELKSISASFTNKNRIIQNEIQELIASISRAQDSLESFKSEAVTKDKFEMEIAKLDQRLKRSSSYAKEAMANCEGIQLKLKDEYVSRDALSRELAMLRRAIANTDKKASKAELIPSILERIEELERALESQNRRTRQMVSRRDLDSAVNSLKQRLYLLRRELFKEAKQPAQQQPTEHEITESVSQEHAPELKIREPEPRKEGPKQEGLLKKAGKGIRRALTITGRIITDFFTVEEKTEKEKIQKGKDEQEVMPAFARRRNQSKITYVIIALLILFALALLLVFNFQSVSEFFSSLKQGGALQSVLDWLSAAAASVWDFVMTYIAYIALGILIIVAAVILSSERVASSLRILWKWLKGLFKSRGKKVQNKVIQKKGRKK